MAGPITTASLTWTHDQQFEATSGHSTLTIDGQGKLGPNPVETLAVALAGCMAIDVVDIVKKGRHDLRGLAAHLTANRAEEPPRRFVAVALHFVVSGDVPGAAVERALQLSKDKYCSVWQTLRQDIPFTTTYEVRP